MKVTRIVVLKFLVLALLSLPLSACRGGSHSTRKDDSIRIRLVHPPELQSYLNSMVEAFQLGSPKLSDGTSVSIELKSVPALEAATDIASGKLKTHAWLSPSTSLVNYTNSSLRNLGPAQIDCQQLFATPIVVAVQSRHTPFFQENQRQFSWDEVINAAIEASPDSPPSRLRFNHSSPLSSTTGLSALIQLAYMATGKSEGELNLEDLKGGQAFNLFKRYQSLISSYGFNELSLLNSVAIAKTDVVLFSISTEQQVAFYNSKSSSAPLIALYPNEGSFWMDYSICLSEADWVPPSHAAAVRMFVKFLTTEPAQLAIEKRGFRPSVLPLPPLAPLTKEFGIDFKAGRRALIPVPGSLVDFLIKSWGEIMRPSATVLVLDTSGSMEGAALRLGKDYFRRIIAGSSWKDLKSLISFSTTPTVVSEFGTDADTIIPALDALEAVGGSAVYDAIRKSFEYLIHSKLDAYRKTIIVYTDGEDKNSEASLSFLLSYIQEQLKHNSVNFIVVAVGRDSDFNDLREIAQTANGMFRQGGLDDLQAIFTEVQANL